MEYQLHKQLFSCYSVNIYERYNLSEQYTPNKLMDMYKDSLLEELRQNNILGYNILNNSKIDCKDNQFFFNVEDNFIYKNVCGEFSNYITDVFSNKFGCDINIKYKFYKPKDEKQDTEIVNLDDLKPRKSTNIIIISLLALLQL